MAVAAYRGRFAPSPTGPLHAGSLVAALASWLDARAHGGTWLVRIEDTDTARCEPGAAERILSQLAACGLRPDEPPWSQAARTASYRTTLDGLLARGDAYPCGCTRSDIADALRASGRDKPRHGELVYPGTCRDGLHGKPARAVRLRADAGPDRGAIAWTDRRLGPQHQHVPDDVGDFVLLRADGVWAYQLAVVADDIAQGITDIVRGEDLADNTARQIVLQQVLGATRPRYLHTPLVRDGRGEKLSKQHGAPALDVSDPVAALAQAGDVLGLVGGAGRAKTPSDWLAAAVPQWAAAWPSG